MSKFPTDRQVLRCIYSIYKSSYPGAKPTQTRGENDPYVPIDVRTVASRLNTQPELLFNIGGVAYLVAELWPYLALGCTLALWEKEN